jgi:hypothetical protein
LPDKTRRRFKVTVVTTLNQFFDEDKKLSNLEKNIPEYKFGFGNGPRLLTPSAGFSAYKFPWAANSSDSDTSGRTTPYKNVSSSIPDNIVEACFSFFFALFLFLILI